MHTYIHTKVIQKTRCMPAIGVCWLHEQKLIMHVVIMIRFVEELSEVSLPICTSDDVQITDLILE